jgi:transcriptional regulator with XRE-family HTH domain
MSSPHEYDRDSISCEPAGNRPIHTSARAGNHRAAIEVAHDHLSSVDTGASVAMDDATVPRVRGSSRTTQSAPRGVDVANTELMEADRRIHEFLKTRREGLTPHDVGLPWAADGRRVPGLRREEVARLAGVSVDYYTRLEQGRAKNVSEQVLNAVADALKLDDLERAHLIQLASPQRAKSTTGTRGVDRVRPSVHLVLEGLHDCPAYVRDRRMNVIASNQLWRALFSNMDGYPGRNPNIARWTFLDPRSAEAYPDWETVAREIVHTLRASAAVHPSDSQLNQLLGELTARSEHFCTWWAEHRVFERSQGSKRVRSGTVGELRLSYDAFKMVGNDDLTLVVYTADRGSPSEDQLRLLAAWADADQHEHEPPRV